MKYSSFDIILLFPPSESILYLLNASYKLRYVTIIGSYNSQVKLPFTLGNMNDMIFKKMLSSEYYFTGGTFMYLDGLDELDQKIIQLLIENARISYSDIGEEIEISRVAVKARIQALEKKGVIEEYTTIINPQKSAVVCHAILRLKQFLSICHR